MSDKSILIEKMLAHGIAEEDIGKILDKAIQGGETCKENLYIWARDRFFPNLVLIDKNEYSLMCINALKIAGGVAATDYGSSRQRDMGQLWADLTRGYLGEVAVVKFLKEKWGIVATLGHERGDLKDYLPTDIHSICKPGEEERAPKLSVGIKATKWNGIWLDIPGNQFEHSDIHILVKIGIGRHHLFAFFKEISVFKDKVLKLGEQTGALTQKESNEIYDNLPSFRSIPAYICGFALKNRKYSDLPFEGKMGRKHYKITSWEGAVQAGDLERIRKNEKVPGKVEFESIGRFSHDSGYLFNTGKLLWEKDDWKKIIDQF